MKLSPRLQKWAMLLSAMVAASIVIGFGIYARSAVLEANPCAMTMSKREKTEVSLCGKNCEYKLWKISNAMSKSLNDQPVLYIPGHLGSANQARSVASYMHDDQSYFQVFALDFNEGSSALHGSDVFAQAHAVNMAIDKIVKMYGKKKGSSIDLSVNSTRKVMLVGHSVGGMVARASLMLSSHPQCAVRDIIQLGTPNVRPSYSPDGTLEAAYNLINRAWGDIYHNSTALHGICARLSMPVLDAGGDVDRTVTPLQFTCPTCITSVRLVSFSGGELDLEVPADISNLHTMFPAPAVPRLSVAPATTTSPTSISWYFGFLKTAFNGVIGAGKSLNFPTPATGTTRDSDVTPSAVDVSTSMAAAEETERADHDFTDDAGTSSTINNNNNNNNDVIGSEEVAVDVDGTGALASADITVPTTKKASNITTNTATQTTASASHSEPTMSLDTISMPRTLQFFSVRSSQLKNVGFPIDHAAIVWCYDFLHVVTSGMKRLSKTDSNTPVEWSKVFPHHIMENVTYSTLSEGSFTQHFQYRRQAQLNWLAARDREKTYIANKMPWSSLLVIPFEFVMRHLLKIAVCYLVVSCLVLLAPMLRVLTGNSASLCDKAGCWENILPWNHLSVDIVHATAFNVIKTSIPPTMWRQIFTAAYQIMFFLFLCKVAFDYFFGSFSTATYIELVHWTVAYFAALLLRGGFLVVVQSIQWVCTLLSGLTRAALRMTIWNKTIRTYVRGVMKSVDSWSSSSLPFYSTYAPCLLGSLAPSLLAAVWTLVFVTARHHVTVNRRDITPIAFGLSVLTIVMYIVMCAGLVAALVLPILQGRRKASGRGISPFHVDILLMYLPAPVLAFPSVMHAHALLYRTGSIFPAAAGLYSMFYFDQLLCILAMIAIAAHVWATRFTSALPAKVKALRWMQEVVGPPLLLDYTDLFGSTYTEGPNSSASDGGYESGDDEGTSFGSATGSSQKLQQGPRRCFHEDGGKFAVFEEVLFTDEGVEKVVVADGVVLGSTYRVVSCNCAKDRTLADQTEFCSWCRCRKCGGKHLPPERGRFYTHSDGMGGCDGESDTFGLEDSSSDLIPVAGLLVVVYLSVAYVQRSPFVYLYLLGLVAGAFVVREVSYAQTKKTK